MSALLASILVFITAVPFTFISQPAAEAAAFERTNFSKIQQRKLFMFGYIAVVKCKYAKSRISESNLKILLDDEFLKLDPAEVSRDFLNDKRVNELNNFLAKYLYDNSENCEILDEKMIEDNIAIFLELVELVVFLEEEKPLPSGKDWLNNKK